MNRQEQKRLGKNEEFSKKSRNYLEVNMLQLSERPKKKPMCSNILAISDLQVIPLEALANGKM
ncbi:MAG: hypothetical protein FJ303_13785 [Planctomycetes bacterium]|nr:hypothetical protein [Planctomycetota bacterium]